MDRTWPWWLGALEVVALVFASACSGGGGGGGGTGPAPPLRTFDWLVVSGAQLSAYAGVAPEALRVYAYRQGTFEPVPFQLDERHPDGSWVFRTYPGETDEAVGVDDNDELVVMAADLGDQAPADAWLDDAEARTHPRLELVVSDPLPPARTQYLYVFQTTTGPSSPVDYVRHVGRATFTSAPPQVIGRSYAMGFNSHYRDTLYDYLSIFADPAQQPTAPNLLDKMKGKATARIRDPLFGNWVTVNFNESIPQITVSLEGLIDGPVRVVELTARRVRLDLLGQPLVDTTVRARALYYPWAVQVPLAFDPEQVGGGLPEGVEKVVVAATIDFNEQVKGMHFSNAHVQGVPVDGVPDEVPETLSEWSMISGQPGHIAVVGSYGGYAGLSFCYRDDEGNSQSECVASVSDTGDGKSYGESGLLVDVDTFLADPNATAADLTQTIFLFSHGEEGGEQLLHQRQSPLAVSVVVTQP